MSNLSTEIPPLILSSDDEESDGETTLKSTIDAVDVPNSGTTNSGVSTVTTQDSGYTTKRKLQPMVLVEKKTKLRKSLVLRNQAKNYRKPSVSKPTSISQKAIKGNKPLKSANQSEKGKIDRVTKPITRQKTLASFNVRVHKSFSQMDFKQSRRFKNETAIFSDASMKTRISRSKTVFEKTISNSSIFYRDQWFTNGPNEQSLRLAAYKVSAAILLNGWRKLRQEVKALSLDIEHYKHKVIKANNQVHVLTSVFKVEQKHNNKLTNDCRRLRDKINVLKLELQALTTANISLKSEKSLLEQTVEIKMQELEVVNGFLIQTKAELFKSMGKERELQAMLSNQQRKVQNLMNEKQELNKKVTFEKSAAAQREFVLNEELKLKTEELIEVQTEMNVLLTKISEYERKDKLICSFRTKEVEMQSQIEQLLDERAKLQKCMEQTFSSRVKSMWHGGNGGGGYQRYILQTLQFLLFLALPAATPPKLSAIPVGLSLEKACRLVRRS